MQALNLQNGNDHDHKTEAKHPSESTLVTTKSLANDSGLEDRLKKIGDISMDDKLLTLGATEQPLSVPLERVDNNPQVFLGTQHQAQSKKEGETEPLLIPDFKGTATYDGSVEDEQEIGGSPGARIVLRAPRSKPKLETFHCPCGLPQMRELCTSYQTKESFQARPRLPIISHTP